MSHSSNFIALLDACVLYPASTRDVLLSLADQEMYRPRWSAEIQDEWRRNLLINRQQIPPEILQRTIDYMNRAFPDANVEDFEKIKSGLILPDLKDTHVLAAAIAAKADVIVTSNLSDFPIGYVSAFNIEVIDPDTFILNLIDLDDELSLQALHELSNRLKSPPQSLANILNSMKRNGLVKSAKRFQEIL